jgi:acyl-CoA thioesterase I
MSRSRRVLLIASGAVVVLAVTAFAAVQTPAATEQVASADSQHPSSSASPTATTSSPAAQRTVVAIGDSIMDGHGVKPSHAWPEVVADESDWNLTDLASDGSGFIAIGDDGDTFIDQAVEAVSLDPSLVIIAASSNDLGEDPTEVADATAATLTFLHDQLPDAQIIAFNAFWGAETPPAALSDIDAGMADAASITGADYIDIGQPLAGQDDLMQADGVHPTSRGLKVIAAAIVAAISGDESGAS